MLLNLSILVSHCRSTSLISVYKIYVLEDFGDGFTSFSSQTMLIVIMLLSFPSCANYISCKHHHKLTKTGKETFNARDSYS